MIERLIAETKQLEKDIRAMVREGEGSRAEERASSYFGHSRSLKREVVSGRLKPEYAAELRHISAVCTKRKVEEIVNKHKICRAALESLFAEFRRKSLVIMLDSSCRH